MDTLLIIRQNYSSFTTVEKKIADYIFEVGEKMLEKSAQEVAGEIGSSSAALVRFSRKLGYDGFSQFKQKLSASYAAHVDDEEYYKEVNDSESPTSIKNKLKVRVNHMVETTNSALLDDEIMEAVSSIDAAENIFVFGIGASSMVAQDIFQKFSRIGKQVIFIQDAHLFVSSLSVSNKNNLHWNFNEGETKEVLELASVVKNMKIPIIAITSRENSSLGQMADCILHSVSGEDYQMRTAATMSLMAQLYVVDILFYMYVSEHFTESYDKLEKTRDAIKLLEKK